MPKRRLEDENNENIQDNDKNSDDEIEENELESEIVIEEDESGEDLFGSNFMDDYKPRPELDYYDLESTQEEEEIEEEIPYMYEETTPLIINNISLKEQLKTFLNTKHKDIKRMCTLNHSSLFVNYDEIENKDLLIKDTENFLEIFNSALESVVKSLFPNYFLIQPKVHVRIKEVPLVENIPSLRNAHLNTLVKVRGVVTRRSSVFPLPLLITFICNKCLVSFSSDFHTVCIACQSKGPFTINTEKTIYKDLQKITVQEIPGTVPPGRLPRQKEVHLFYDLIESVKPGEEVEITGIYKNVIANNTKNNFSMNNFCYPVFSTIIEAVTVEKPDVVELKGDIKFIKKISKHPHIQNIIFNSIAPFIYGHKNIKKAIALSMFGGQRKQKEGHNIRGDINVLLLGDPGTAKSQFLRYVEKTIERSVLATGQGASSVGLTASVRRDTNTKEWTLEGGALVLADKSICLIDEFDKMNVIDRVSIHEAMEQQSISISKAGIVATLNARCAVIAAANPKSGRYNSNKTFGENVDLGDPIISRFDILCVIKDIIGSEDKIMGEFIINSHQECNSKGEDTEMKSIDDGELVIKKDKYNNDILDQDSLRKYIQYAKNNCFPTITTIDKEKISTLYSELRKESRVPGSIPITARHIESIVRMSEAFARIKLKNTVSTEDIDAAIEMALESFISTQKNSIAKALRKKFSKYLNAGNEALLYILNELFVDKMNLNKNILKVTEFENRLKNIGMKITRDFYQCVEFKLSGYKLIEDDIVMENH